MSSPLNSLPSTLPEDASTNLEMISSAVRDNETDAIQTSSKALDKSSVRAKFSENDKTFEQLLDELQLVPSYPASYHEIDDQYSPIIEDFSLFMEEKQRREESLFNEPVPNLTLPLTSTNVFDGTLEEPNYVNKYYEGEFRDVEQANRATSGLVTEELEAHHPTSISHDIGCFDFVNDAQISDSHGQAFKNFVHNAQLGVSHGSRKGFVFLIHLDEDVSPVDNFYNLPIYGIQINRIGKSLRVLIVFKSPMLESDLKNYLPNGGKFKCLSNLEYKRYLRESSLMESRTQIAGLEGYELPANLDVIQYTFMAEGLSKGKISLSEAAAVAPDVYAKHLNSLLRMDSMVVKEKHLRKDLEFYFLSGAPGTGKTIYSKTLSKYLKKSCSIVNYTTSNFWNVSGEEETIVLEEFPRQPYKGRNSSSPIELLNLACTPGACNVPVKFASRNLSNSLIIIISNFDMDEIVWSCDSDQNEAYRQGMKRRVTWFGKFRKDEAPKFIKSNDRKRNEEKKLVPISEEPPLLYKWYETVGLELPANAILH